MGLYLSNELIQQKLGDNLRLIFRTIGALHAANVNIVTLAEKHLAPMVLSAIERQLQERLNSQM